MYEPLEKPLMRVVATLTALTLALVACSGQAPEPVVEEPIEPPTTDIWKASGEGSIDLVQQHIDAGTDVNGTFNIEGVPGTGGTPLHIAVLAHKNNVVELLIENGAKLNQQAVEPDPFGGPPLHWAIVAENLDGIMMLVEAGANVNISDNFGTTSLDVALLDLQTFTPMQYTAISASKRAIYDYLYEQGAKHQ